MNPLLTIIVADSLTLFVPIEPFCNVPYALDLLLVLIRPRTLLLLKEVR